MPCVVGNALSAVRSPLSVDVAHRRQPRRHSRDDVGKPSGFGSSRTFSVRGERRNRHIVFHPSLTVAAVDIITSCK
jgi:hypothetical protein